MGRTHIKHGRPRPSWIKGENVCQVAPPVHCGHSLSAAQAAGLAAEDTGSQSDRCQGALACSTGQSLWSPWQKLASQQGPCPVGLLVKDNTPRGAALLSIHREARRTMHHPRQTRVIAFLTAMSLREGSHYGTSIQAGARCPGRGAGRLRPQEAAHLLLSGCRLSTRHLSCSSPRWILSSSSRCSMMRADFILTKYS